MDRLTPQQRSKNMAQIKSKNTKPEQFVFSFLDKKEVCYKKHYDISGKPDIVFPELRIAVFINGEFWHGRYFKNESSKYPEFWIKKISGNMARDKKNYRFLKKEGWKVIKIWDKQLKKNPIKELNKIMKANNLPLISKSDLKI